MNASHTLLFSKTDCAACSECLCLLSTFGWTGRGYPDAGICKNPRGLGPDRSLPTCYDNDSVERSSMNEKRCPRASNRWNISLLSDCTPNRILFQPEKSSHPRWANESSDAKQ